MRAIFSKEIQNFFSSATGYLVVGIFLIACALFLFIFSGEYNILDNGFADIKPFFNLAPWIFIFLIPAVTMKSFAEEKKQGTLELLLSKPIPHYKLILGKFLAALFLVILALLPSLLYVFTIYNLGNPVGNIDVGATLGSYLGLVFLASCYTAIGIFASVLTKNQIVAFMLGLFLCFLSFFLFEGLADIPLFESLSYGLEYFGIQFHYRSISRGVIDTRDIIYFLSIITLFLKFTHFHLKQNQQKS